MLEPFDMTASWLCCLIKEQKKKEKEKKKKEKKKGKKGEKKGKIR